MFGAPTKEQKNNLKLLQSNSYLMAFERRIGEGGGKRRSRGGGVNQIFLSGHGNCQQIGANCLYTYCTRSRLSLSVRRERKRSGCQRQVMAPVAAAAVFDLYGRHEGHPKANRHRRTLLVVLKS